MRIASGACEGKSSRVICQSSTHGQVVWPKAIKPLDEAFRHLSPRSCRLSWSSRLIKGFTTALLSFAESEHSLHTSHYTHSATGLTIPSDNLQPHLLKKLLNFPTPQKQTSTTSDNALLHPHRPQRVRSPPARSVTISRRSALLRCKSAVTTESAKDRGLSKNRSAVPSTPSAPPAVPPPTLNVSAPRRVS